MGEGDSITENTNPYGFLELVLGYGNPWDGERHRPYDRFDVYSQSNIGDKTRQGRLLIRGDPGVGGAAELYMLRKKRPLVTARYRYSYVDVRNGSICNSEDRGLGLDATHHVQQVNLKGEVARGCSSPRRGGVQACAALAWFGLRAEALRPETRAWP